MRTLGTIGWYFAICALVISLGVLLVFVAVRLFAGRERLAHLSLFRRLPFVCILELFGAMIGFVVGVFVTNVQASHGAGEPAYGPFESPEIALGAVIGACLGLAYVVVGFLCPKN